MGNTVAINVARLQVEEHIRWQIGVSGLMNSNHRAENLKMTR